jgi:RsiW-degrading membrane proteinase PrsW (M82 family)
MIPSGDTYNHVVLQSRFTYMVYSVFQYIIYIGASIWLYKEAKTNNNKPWLWALLGLFGGLIAVVLWYLKKIHSLLSAQETK